MGLTRPLAPSTVLVVEDEPLLRLHAVALIEDAGIDVVEAGNADQAVAILEARIDIGVVFTDIDMPGSMDGIMLAAAVRDRWPPVAIIVTSGQQSPAPGDLPIGGLLFPKPYEDAAVLRAIRRLAA